MLIIYLNQIFPSKGYNMVEAIKIKKKLRKKLQKSGHNIDLDEILRLNYFIIFFYVFILPSPNGLIFEVEIFQKSMSFGHITTESTKFQHHKCPKLLKQPQQNICTKCYTQKKYLQVVSIFERFYSILGFSWWFALQHNTHKICWWKKEKRDDGKIVIIWSIDIFTSTDFGCYFTSSVAFFLMAFLLHKLIWFSNN